MSLRLPLRHVPVSRDGGIRTHEIVRSMESHRHSPARNRAERARRTTRGLGGPTTLCPLSYIPMSRDGRIRTGDLRLRRHGVPPAFARRRARRSVPLARRKRVEPRGRRGGDGTGPGALPLSYCARAQAGIEPATSWVHGVPSAFARGRARRGGPHMRRRGGAGRLSELPSRRTSRARTRDLHPRVALCHGVRPAFAAGDHDEAVTRRDVTSPPRRSGTRTRSAGAP